MGKKKKETFQEFRSNEKSAYTTIKTTLKSVLHNHKEVQPVITNLVFEMNDLYDIFHDIVTSF